MRKITIDNDVKIQGIVGRFSLNSLVAQKMGQQIAIRDVEEDDLIILEQFDEISDNKGFLWGTNIDDAVAVLNLEFEQANCIEGSLAPQQKQDTLIKVVNFKTVWIEQNTTGQEIVPIGVYDPTNVSTQDASLIDGELNDLVYNNNRSGTVNKELPAIDLGEAIDVASVDLYWWSNSYTASNYKIQGSVDGNEWTDIQTNLASTGIVGTNSNPQKIEINQSVRYIRAFIVQGNNASWAVISELKAFGAGGTVINNASSQDIVAISAQNGLVTIENKSSQTINYKIVKQ